MGPETEAVVGSAEVGVLANCTISSWDDAFEREIIREVFIRVKQRDQREEKNKKEMANKVCNLTDLVQRVTASCLLHPLARGHEPEDYSENQAEDEEDEVQSDCEENEVEEGFTVAGEKKREVTLKRVREMEVLMGEVFDAVSSMKKAYVNLQDAHCPWDPEKMRTADVAVVAELRRLGNLREKFRRRVRGAGRGGPLGLVSLREAVAPYEAALEELKREVKAKDVEIENLKEKLSNTTTGGKKGRLQSRKKISSIKVVAAPGPELFEAIMSQVKEKSKSFAAFLLSLMRSAHWDITAAVRSIEAATTATMNDKITFKVEAHHAKYALESYVCQKMFQGFDHETFYMDGSLSSLLNPDQYRRDCFTQFQDMKAMDPVELLGILPSCQFGKFCSKKFLSIVHPKMEESLFGNLEQRNLILAGNHPRSQFYKEYLALAKAVWLLHLLAFALEPAPCHFQASKGADFHPEYMEGVIKFSGGRVPVGQVVAFPVSPGFKLGNGSVIKARVYLMSRTSQWEVSDAKETVPPLCPR
ncbi:protein GRAVITROPIC IN THE LIGHT 1 isoform X2 [Macadamia integrifolia]|uniref:protein GRAVITROPIC IN THE LIGHT 1 isoform X2 n=1 Tax=Macadamia integrifolia TaxID=60698 RepID=UPI001C52E38F|nr:protein GRAVITROPIC IN THE LIGHT 1 isoform X2 [Macadamia integrifolia]